MKREPNIFYFKSRGGPEAEGEQRALPVVVCFNSQREIKQKGKDRLIDTDCVITKTRATHAQKRILIFYRIALYKTCYS